MAALAAELERLAGPRGRPGEAPKPGEPQRVSMRADGRKKIHTTFEEKKKKKKEKGRVKG